MSSMNIWGHRSTRAVGAAVLTVTALAGLSIAGYAQAPAGSVWQGAYTAEQAERGKAAYAENCASCHSPTLAGGDSAPALAGGQFLNNWNGTSTGDLHERIKTTMPANDPGTLSGKTVAVIEAYIFQVNNFPAGTVALPADAQMMAGTKILATKPAG